MQLLDLPPELFQRIIANHVANVGLCEAWKHREVCKTFDGYITDQVFGKQPLRVYKRKSSGRLLEKGLSRYLECRTQALYGAHDIVPSRIRQTVDKIITVMGDTSNEKRAKYTRSVCAAIIKYASSKRSLIINPTPSAIKKLDADTEDSMLMCIAVAIEDVDLVNALATQNISIWTNTNILGSPLSLAIQTQNQQMLSIVLQLSTTKATDVLFQTRARILEVALHTATIHRHWSSATILASWHMKHLGRPDRRFCCQMLARVHMRGQPRFLKVLLDMGFDERLARHYRRQFLRDWCSWDAGKNTLRLLLKKNILSVSEPSYRVYTAEGTRNMSLLEYAINEDVVDVEYVQLLLESGADPNGIKKKDGSRSYPLRALRLGDLDVHSKVQLLLDHGADPEAGSDPNDRFTMDLVEGDRDLRRLIYYAIKEKIDRLGDQYRPPRCWQSTWTGIQLVTFRLLPSFDEYYPEDEV